LPPNEREEYARNLAAVREAPGQEAFARAWAAGGEMTLEDAIRLRAGRRRRVSEPLAIASQLTACRSCGELAATSRIRTAAPARAMRLV
jgi:hypothetical protein